MTSRDKLYLADVLGFLLIIAILGSICYWAIKDRKQKEADWEAFKIMHECKALDVKTKNEQVAWKCDDRQIYLK